MVWIMSGCSVLGQGVLGFGAGVLFSWVYSGVGAGVLEKVRLFWIGCWCSC